MRPGHSAAKVNNEQIKSVGGRPWQRADTETGFIGENSAMCSKSLFEDTGRAALR